MSYSLLCIFQNFTATWRKRGAASHRGVPGADVRVHLPVPDPWPPNSSSLQRREGAADYPSGSSLQHPWQIQWQYWKGMECNALIYNREKLYFLLLKLQACLITLNTNAMNVTLSTLHSGIQNLQREFPQTVPADQVATLPHLLHQKIHQEQLLCGEKPNNCQLPNHVR